MKPAALATPLAFLAVLAAPPAARAQATSVPTDIQQPGTQPGEASVESPTKCDNCHGGYDAAVEPAFNWRGSMMAHASRDPIYWASVAIAEQDFPGSGDLCIRCHAADGWTAMRSTPTDGSGLGKNDDTGVACDVCHALTNPDDSELLGVQNDPFVANDGGTPVEGFYGSAMYVLWGGNQKLGPYLNPPSTHASIQSHFHRSPELCGTCHDVSNPAVGDLAPSHGAFQPLPAGSFSGTPGTPVAGKAAFNNPAYAYGIVERTYSEHVSSAFPTLEVKDYGTLPLELQAGAIAEAEAAAMASNPLNDGNYLDGTPRTFTCQTCHMPPVFGEGCNKGVPARADLPLHDQTGGNYWMPDVLTYMDGLGQLVLGGGLTTEEENALQVGQARALHNLSMAAALEVDEDEVKVVNLTGHKLISGYPEGRRMWLHIVWRDGIGTILREDGEYGDLAVTINGNAATVRTLKDLEDPNTRIYEVKPGISQAWASTLLAPPYNVPAGFVLTYDRVTGAPVETLGDVAALPAGSALMTFHFVLNDTILSDTRIPPYGMRYGDAVDRNITPVPAAQYGNPSGASEVYEHYDELHLSPPTGAVSATIELLYQPTSWEYIQFLALANTGQSSFLANEGDNLLQAWMATGMAEPVVMTSATWSASGCTGNLVNYCTAGTTANGCTALVSASGTPSASAASGFDLAVTGGEGSKDGILFFGTNGRQANPWGNGTSYQCVVPPVVRTGLQSGTGTNGACDGGLTLDFNAWMSANPQKAPATGVVVDLQCWFRDPLNTSNQTTSLSDALEFTICP
jgi:hypothetical protein